MRPRSRQGAGPGPRLGASRLWVGAVCCLPLCGLPLRPVLAAQYVVPPILPVPDAWQGRATGLVRVLDKLDAHVEVLTLSAGQTGHYKSLAVTLRSCMDRPDGMPHDAAAFLDVQDAHGNGQPFTGWTFAGEPSIGVFESPVYGVQLVNCQGDQVAPAAPPLPAAVPAPPGLLPQPRPPSPDTDTDNGDTGAPDAVDQGQPAIEAPNPSAGQPSGRGDDQPGTQPGTPHSTPPAADATQQDQAPDAVYPDGSPPRRP